MPLSYAFTPSCNDRTVFIISESFNPSLCRTGATTSFCQTQRRQCEMFIQNTRKAFKVYVYIYIYMYMQRSGSIPALMGQDGRESASELEG